MKEKTWQLVVKNYDKVLIVNPQSPEGSQMEYSVEFDTSTLQIRKWGERICENFRLLRYAGDTLANWIGNPEYYIPQEAIEAARKQVRKEIRKVKQDLKDVKSNPLYLEMKEEVEAYVKNFKSDFYFHDALYLQRKNPQRFGWIVRDSGTWLIISVTGFTEVIVRDATKDFRYFTYENGKLKQATAQEFTAFFYTLPNLKGEE